MLPFLNCDANRLRKSEPDEGVMKTKFKLLPTVLICVGALVLLSAGSIFVLNIISNRAIVSELTSRIVARSLGGLELALRAHLDAAKYQAEFIADTIRSGNLNFNERDKLAEFATGSLAAAPQIGGLIVANADGEAIRVARAPAGRVKRDWLSLEDDGQLEDLAKDTKLRKNPYWGPPIHRNRFNATVLNLRVPIWRNDNYLGFVAVAISTQALSQLALELSEPPRSTVFVLYGRDKVLAHMFQALRPHGLSADKPLLAISEIVDPVIGRLGEARPLRTLGFLPPKGIDALELESGGTRYLVFEKTLTGYGEVPLLIGAYSVASAVDAPLRAMYRTVAIGAALLGVALVISVLISRVITRPIRETSDSAAAIASLDFEDIAPLRESHIKEIDDLSNSFNAMLVGLKAFGRYVPHSLVKRLIRENQVGAGTEERELTVMFTDIAGFTTICEGMSPADVAAFINHHLALVSECIEREGGTIDKYIGDAVMAFWGAPDSINDAPIRASLAAVAIQGALAGDNKKRDAAGLSPVRMRIGIHSGRLIVGDIGAPNRINYTVVGDVVNVAQRLEALGKDIAPEAESIVLVSRATKDGLDDRFKLTKAGRIRMKGKQKELGVYRIVSRSDTRFER